MSDTPSAQDKRAYFTTIQNMGDGHWAAVCSCGWTGQATNDITASWDAHAHAVHHGR